MTRQLLAAAAVLALSAPAISWAEQSTSERVRFHVEAGNDAFRVEDYNTAIEEFRAARALREDPMLLYNIAVAYERLELRREAIEHYEDYLQEAPDADNAPEVRERIDALHLQRSEEQTEPVEVDAVDESRGLDELEHTRLEAARHELDLQLGVTGSLAGLLEGAGFGLNLSYHFRINPTWHIGLSLLGDWHGKSGEGARRSHYGLALGGRWSIRPIDVLEIRLCVGIGYQFINTHQNERLGTTNGHWVFVRLGPQIAWDVYEGFGFVLSLTTRLGYLEGFGADNTFGASLDATIGVFWAF